MLFIITSLPPHSTQIYPSWPLRRREKKSRAKGILGIETAPLLPPLPTPKLIPISFHSLPLSPSLSLSLSLSPNFPISFPSHNNSFSFPATFRYREIYSNCGKKNSSILPETAPESPNPREHSSMQPRRSRFTELIDIPLTNSTCSSSSELSLDDVLRETEQKFSQNRVVSFWNGWDHVGSGLQRQHSMPRSWLRKRNTGEIPRNVFGPSKAPWFWAAIGYSPKGFDQGGDSRLDCLMEESFLSLFSFGTCSSRKHTHACGPLPKLPKGPSIFDWDVREITHSLTRVAWSSSHLL